MMKKTIFALLLFFAIGANAQFSTKTSTGTIKEGTALLKLTKSIGIKAGDVIAVQTNAKRGGVGAGGAFPFTWYKSAAEMNADKSKPDGFWAFVKDQKGIYRVNGSTGNFDDVSWPSFDASIPLSLRDTVLKVTSAGRYIYLKHNAIATETNARVIIDQAQIFHDYVEQNKTFDAKKLKLKKGDTLFFASKVVWNYYPLNLKILGNGITISSIKGGMPVFIGEEYGNGCANWKVDNLDLNAGATYEGMTIDPTPGQGLPRTNEPFGKPYTPTLALYSKCDTVTNVTVHNPIAYGFEVGGENNLVRNCHIIVDKDGYKGYSGWPFHILGLNNWIDNCSFFSAYLMRAWEIQQGYGNKITNCTSYNGLWALNATDKSQLINNTTYLTPGCADANLIMLGNPALDINNRLAFGQDYGGLVVDGWKLIYQGYLTHDSATIRGIVFDNAGNVTVKNSLIDRPDVTGQAGWGNNQGSHVSGTGDYLSFENCVFKGRMWHDNGRVCGLDSYDNAPFILRGLSPSKVTNVEVEQVVVGPNVIISGLKSDCPVVRKTE